MSTHGLRPWANVVSPLQGLKYLCFLQYPGRCPGLSYFAHLGPKAKVDEILTDYPDATAYHLT